MEIDELISILEKAKQAGATQVYFWGGCGDEEYKISHNQINKPIDNLLTSDQASIGLEIYRTNG